MTNGSIATSAKTVSSIEADEADTNTDTDTDTDTDNSVDNQTKFSNTSGDNSGIINIR